MIRLIAAKTKSGVIGNGDSLPWKEPDEMKFFKTLTTNNIVVMGRKTFESIGKELPNRENYIISKTLSGPNVFDDLISCLGYLIATKTNKIIYIIGGASIYKECLENKIVSELIISELKEEYPGDVYFPDIPKEYYLYEIFQPSERFVVKRYKSLLHTLI